MVILTVYQVINISHTCGYQGIIQEVTFYHLTLFVYNSLIEFGLHVASKLLYGSFTTGVVE